MTDLSWVVVLGAVSVGAAGFVGGGPKLGLGIWLVASIALLAITRRARRDTTPRPEIGGREGLVLASAPVVAVAAVLLLAERMSTAFRLDIDPNYYHLSIVNAFVSGTSFGESIHPHINFSFRPDAYPLERSRDGRRARRPHRWDQRVCSSSASASVALLMLAAVSIATHAVPATGVERERRHAALDRRRTARRDVRRPADGRLPRGRDAERRPRLRRARRADRRGAARRAAARARRRARRHVARREDDDARPRAARPRLRPDPSPGDARPRSRPRRDGRLRPRRRALVHPRPARARLAVLATARRTLGRPDADLLQRLRALHRASAAHAEGRRPARPRDLRAGRPAHARRRVRGRLRRAEKPGATASGPLSASRCSPGRARSRPASSRATPTARSASARRAATSRPSRSSPRR